ncbi:hypothetical protein ACXYMU_06445 [Pontibacter sp. CAU 1760]
MDISNLIFIATVGFYTLLLTFILTWMYHDAEQRGLNGGIIVGIAFFTGTILGLLAWLTLRPKLKPQPIPVKS